MTCEAPCRSEEYQRTICNHAEGSEVLDVYQVDSCHSFVGQTQMRSWMMLNSWRTWMCGLGQHCSCLQIAAASFLFRYQSTTNLHAAMLRTGLTTGLLSPRLDHRDIHMQACTACKSKSKDCCWAPKHTLKLTNE